MLPLKHWRSCNSFDPNQLEFWWKTANLTDLLTNEAKHSMMRKTVAPSISILPTFYHVFLSAVACVVYFMDLSLKEEQELK